MTRISTKVEVAKAGGQAQIVFEAAANVEMDGAVLIRKGALATGRFTEAKAASGNGKAAAMTFVIDQVTAVDGQSVSLTSAQEGGRGKSGATVHPGYAAAVGAPPGSAIIVNSFVKGSEVLLRAGTTFDVEVSKTYSVKLAK